MNAGYANFIDIKFTQYLLFLILSAPFSINADILSFAVGGGVWNETPEGNYQTTSDTAKVNVTNNLFWENESLGYAFASLEHPIPVLPNLKIAYTKIKQDGSGETPTFTFDGKTFNGTVSDEASTESLDFYAYYEILDNIISFDLGVNVRNLKAIYNIEAALGATVSASDSYKATFPMLYVMVGTSLWRDLMISSELSYIAYSGNNISDFTAKIAYTTEYLTGLELGYRHQSYEIEDISNTDADLSFEGVFAGAYLKF